MVMYEFVARAPDELSLAVGDRVIVTSKQTDGWWMGHNALTGAKGLFPHNYTKPVPASSSAAAAGGAAAAAARPPAESSFPDPFNVTRERAEDRAVLEAMLLSSAQPAGPAAAAAAAAATSAAPGPQDDSFWGQPGSGPTLLG